MISPMPRDTDELRRRSIDPARIAGVSPVVFDDADRRGVRALQVRNATGLGLTLIPDRGLDASELLFGGVPLTWYGPGNAAPSSSLDPSVDAFARTFFGGLVTTCGMDAFGPPGHDRWGAWPQHGHFNHLAARDVRYGTIGEGPAATIEVTGTVLQFAMFGAALRIERTWTIGMHENTVALHDRVCNDGGSAQPHMVLYHCNVGWPMLDEQTHWRVDASHSSPRDEVAARAFDQRFLGGPPQPAFAEEVYVHTPLAGDDGWARATAINGRLQGGLALTLAYQPAQLPALFSWRMLGYGTYVMAVEPANCANVRGRAAAADDRTLPMLEAGEARDYALRFSVDATGPGNAIHGA
jgi:hypothetical protein